jgi:rubrerythrin
MAAMQMIDLLRRGERFHGGLAAYYEALRNVARREDVQQVLDYLVEHERSIEKCFHEYETTAPKGVSGTWFKITPETCLKKLMEETEIDPDMTVDDLIQHALRFDDCLVALYRQLTEMAISEDLGEALNRILSLEETHERRMVWDLQRD